MALPTIVERDGKYINLSRSDVLEGRDLNSVTSIDGGILHYVRRRMGCETVTREVMREAVAFENEMSRMDGW